MFNEYFGSIHYNDVIMSAMAPQITNLTIVDSIVYSGADHRKYQSSASLAFVRGIHRWPVNSLHKGPVKQKMFIFDYVIMNREAWRYTVCVYRLDNSEQMKLHRHIQLYFATVDIWAKIYIPKTPGSRFIYVMEFQQKLSIPLRSNPRFSKRN